MAELLIKAVSVTHPDSTKDARGCYKRGDIVVLKDDGWPWGTYERTPPVIGGKFVILKITGVTVAQIGALTATRWSTAADGSQVDANRVVLRRRRFQVDIDSLAPGIVATLEATGTYTIAWTALRPAFRDKVTLQTAE